MCTAPEEVIEMKHTPPLVNHALLVRWEPVYRSRLHYVVTWTTRGRKPVLKERHHQSLRSLIPPLCDERGIALIEVVLGPDHLHVVFGLRPSQSVASAVRELKGKTASALMSRHPELRVWLGGHLLWDERYVVETVSPARLERVRDRLKLRHRPLDGLAEAS